MEEEEMRIWRSVWPIYFRGRTDYIYETTLVRKAFSVFPRTEPRSL